MRQVYRILIVLVWVFISSHKMILAQVDVSDEFPSRFLERLESTESEEDLADLVETYQSLQSHPFYFETLNSDQVWDIPELSPEERQQIIVLLPAIDREHPWEQLNSALPEGAVEVLRFAIKSERSRKLTGSGRWRLKFEPGSDIQSYGRMVFNSGNRLNGALVVERDPGEVQLADHLTGGIELNNVHHFTQIVVGSYQMSYGTGLSFGRAMGISKSGNVTGNVNRSMTKLRVNSSSLETAGFTGIAARYQQNDHLIQGFVARTPRDGEFDGTDVQLSAGGLHTTEGMIARQNQIAEDLAGLAYLHRTASGEVGVQTAWLQYRSWDGARITLGENFGSIWFINSWFIHETGIDPAGNRTHFTAIRHHWETMTAVIAHRWYSADYSVRFARGFGEWSGTQNESGIYAGIRWDLGKIRVETYLDRFHEIVAEEYPPREGTEWLLLSSWRPRSRMRLTGKVVVEQKEVNQSLLIHGIVFKRNTLRRKLQYRLSWRYRWDSDFECRVRLDGVRVHLDNREYNGIQSGYEIGYTWRDRLEISAHAVPYFVETSLASTYYYLMPALGTMQLARQTGQGILYVCSVTHRISKSRRWSFFYLHDRPLSDIISTKIALQIDVAF